MQSDIPTPDKSLPEDEKAELEAVLASSLFVRTPSLASLLSYLCRKYFQGEADLLKEYTIGVEAFGRAPDFDKKEDSIVRVESFEAGRFQLRHPSQTRRVRTSATFRRDLFRSGGISGR
ncbi:MAG TPA: hypothetical protein VFY40_29170 [Blastocatellia bacterium]|nr:hypothetical protein [Blastocatellia bacterium]